jgi:hypothetical protein
MSREDFESFIIDPNITDQGIDVSGLRTTTDTSPLLLAKLEPGIRYDPTLQSSYSDLLRYFSGGLPMLPETPTGGEGSGGGDSGITAASTVQPTTPVTGGGVNTPFEQNLIDQGIGVQGAPGDPVVAPGEMPVTQEEMDAFNQIPVTPVGGQPIDPTGMLPQIPTQPDLGEITADDYGTPTYAAGTATLEDAGAIGDMEMPGSDYGYEITPQAIDPTGMLPQTSSARYMVPGALGVDPNEKLDFKSAEDVAKKFNFDPASAAVKFAINSAVGKPVTFFIDVLKDILPPADPRHTAMKEFYNLDETGKVAKGELMAGYGPVHGGLFGDTQYGLQEAYDKRIETVGETLQRNYGFSDEEIEQIKAGNITDAMREKAYNEKMGTTTNNLQKLADLAEAKEKEKARLDLFSGDIQDTGDATVAEKIALQDRLGIGGDIGVEGEDEGRFTTPTTNITSDQIDEFDTTPVTDIGVEGEDADRFTTLPVTDIGVEGEDADRFTTLPVTDTAVIPGVKPGESIYSSARLNDPNILTTDTAPVTTTGGPPIVLNPEPGTISGTQQIPEIKDYVETEDLSFTDPNDRSSIIDKAQELGIGNVDKHFENNSKLAKARDEGIISSEDYNILGGYDVAENITGGSKVLGGAINLVGSPIYNAAQAVLDPETQKLEDIPGTVARNTLGGAGIISLDQKNIHNAIVNGNLDTPEGIAAVKNQIELSQYEDRIMGMVDQPTKGTLAGEPGLPDLMDEFDMTAFDEPITETTPIDPFKDIDTGIEDFPDYEMTNFEKTQAKEQADAQRKMQEQIAAAEKQEAAVRDEKDRQKREADAREAAATRAREAAAARDEKDRQKREADAREAAAARARKEAARDDPIPSQPTYTAPTRTVSRTDTDYGQFGRRQEATSAGGGNNSGGCFLKGTQVTMADGSTKAIEQVDLGDNVAKGGKVFATGKFLVENLHDYKGIKVSGSHMVSEDGNWVRVEDSKHGKALGDDEHTVYVFGAENRRILINDILFTDYFEVNEQEKLSEGDKFFDNWKIHAKVDSDNNVNVLNAN